LIDVVYTLYSKKERRSLILYPRRVSPAARPEERSTKREKLNEIGEREREKTVEGQRGRESSTQYEQQQQQVKIPN